MLFRPGELYSSQEIQTHLQVGNAGGIRVSIQDKAVRRIAILTALPTAKVASENPYHDRVEGNILVYSAGGLQGDQSLGGVNKRIVEQLASAFPIYGFRLNQSRRKAEAKRWEFIGLLQFLRVYPDAQMDRNGVLRKVWLFEFRICSGFSEVCASTEAHIMANAIRDYSFDANNEERVGSNEPEMNVSDVKASAEDIERTRAKIFSLHPCDFELLVKTALEASGFSDVETTRYTQDGGIDVNARASKSHWPIAGMRVQVQAKRWLHTVGRREVAELRGSLEPFASGALVTTSYFSRAALLEATAPGRHPIVLVDGFHFASIAREFRVVSA
jgi:hypothetical protein